jgi:carotenoid cleavage dioxygenase-like enzyme
MRLPARIEDSPPVLETLDDYHTFGGKLRSRTFTAHPKFDAATGEMIAFGYEAAEFASDDVFFAVEPESLKLTSGVITEQN